MNTHHIKLVAKTLLSAVVIHDLVASAKNKGIYSRALERNVELSNENDSLREELESARVQRNYLIVKLEEHGVPATEFDMIVLNRLTQ